MIGDSAVGHSLSVRVSRCTCPLFTAGGGWTNRNQRAEEAEQCCIPINACSSSPSNLFTLPPSEGEGSK
ncbi:unnamed protein product [Boreogadus saida]